MRAVNAMNVLEVFCSCYTVISVKTNVCISYQKGVISRLTPSIPKIGMHSIPPHIRYELHTHWKYALHTPYCMPSILDSYLNYI